MTTFITRYDTSGNGVRLAVKDLIDMKGELTTAGCAAVAERATPAPRDAACLAGARAAGARIVGRTNLHELALGVTGINPWYGTPVNPLDPALVPGGSSSGSAVAVATDQADLAYGSDTGGSIRIPAACCGIAGLKTTWGRVPLEGVWPLSPSFDTVGPMARDVAGLVRGMQLLEPGFSSPRRTGADLVVGRLPPPPIPLSRRLDRASVVGCAPLSFRVGPGHRQADSSWWPRRGSPTRRWRRDPAGIGDEVRGRLALGRPATRPASSGPGPASARGRPPSSLFTQFDFLVTPTLTIFPPPLEDGGPDDRPLHHPGQPGRRAGISVPIPTAGPLPASLQLIGPPHSEERLLAAAAFLEVAANQSTPPPDPAHERRTVRRGASSPGRYPPSGAARSRGPRPRDHQRIRRAGEPPSPPTARVAPPRSDRLARSTSRTRVPNMYRRTSTVSRRH